VTNSNTATTEKANTEQKARESNGKEIKGFAYMAQTLGVKSVMASLIDIVDMHLTPSVTLG
jgi:CHAT domain-containing protein